MNNMTLHWKYDCALDEYYSTVINKNNDSIRFVITLDNDQLYNLYVDFNHGKSAARFNSGMNFNLGIEMRQRFYFDSLSKAKRNAKACFSKMMMKYIEHIASSMSSFDSTS